MGYVDINYLAIFVCAFCAMFIGAMWYGPIFGKQWMEDQGLTEEDVKKDFNPIKTYGLAFVGHIVLAYVVARLLSYISVMNVGQALTIAVLCWVGFIAATKMINYLFEKKTLKLFFINSGYHLINLLVFATILFYWK